MKLGCVRQKLAGGDAGHKGIRDIIEKLGTRDFSRIRIGIGRPDTDIEVSDATDVSGYPIAIKTVYEYSVPGSVSEIEKVLP